LALEALEHMLEDAKQERLTVEYWNECVDAITAIKQARSAPVQEPVKFLANGTRFKTSEFPYGVCINGLPKELSGRWVALIAAEDDCHLKLTTPPAQEFVCSTGLCHYKEQREWVGLTDEEWQDLSDRYGMILFGRFKNEIETKLREKNTP
jgi:hypothetical protein